MRLIVGCPVAERAWALPHWFACLAGQTRRPDGFCFIHSGAVGDATWEALHSEPAANGLAPVAIRHDARAPHPRHDNERFATLAQLRNQLLGLARQLEAELFLSLDSDVMLEHPETIERLERLVVDEGWDLASPLCFLHPMAPATWAPGEDPAWAYNFGWLGQRGDLVRPAVRDIPWGRQLTIDVPMAAWLGNRKAIACSYAHHQSGEDLGFAASLQAAGARCVIDTGLYARHVWSQADFEREQFVA